MYRDGLILPSSSSSSSSSRVHFLLGMNTANSNRNKWIRQRSTQACHMSHPLNIIWPKKFIMMPSSLKQDAACPMCLE